jgi:integrase
MLQPFDCFRNDDCNLEKEEDINSGRVAGSSLDNRLGQAARRRAIREAWSGRCSSIAKAAGVPGLSPHDCRRTGAAGGELEQIQLLLGYASVHTTERYLGTKQDRVHAPNDAIKQRVAV